MCGITGILSLRQSPVDPEVLQRMAGMIRHRGPDDQGIHLDGPSVGLAHTRLSIIDPPRGRQPMHNASKTAWITFNGQIFNHPEIKKELLAKGYRFSTNSDTEVILNLYEEKGEDCVNDLNGQWAFAIWDSRRQKLFLSRDRMGVLPLFYATPPGWFIFASEVKSLLAHPEVPREIDLLALDQIFTFWSTLPPRTFFRDIRELPPGHSLSVSPGEDGVRVRCYWRLDYGEQGAPLPEADYTERLRCLLEDAVRLRLRADVPVAAYLSGGLDSTAVAALMRRLTTTPLRTFSMTFDDPEFDESAFQKESLASLGSEHSQIRCTPQDIAKVFPQVIWHVEKPILRTAPAPLFLLSALVHQMGYKAVMTGEGADELLGGYDIFKEAKIRRFCAAHPSSRLRPLLLRKLYPYLPRLQSQSGAYLEAFFDLGADRSSPFFSHLPRWELTSRLKHFFSEAVRSEVRRHDAYADMENLLPEGYAQWDPFCQAQYLEVVCLLPGYILSSQGDRVNMAHSVEGRFPFLDYRLAEFSTTVPPRLQMRGLKEKYLLKQAVKDLVPLSVRKRPKQPYRAPEAQCFFGAVRHDYVEELLSPNRLEKDGIFNHRSVSKLVEKSREARSFGVKDNMALVGILSTQLVVEQFVRNFGRPAAPGPGVGQDIVTAAP